MRKTTVALALTGLMAGSAAVAQKIEFNGRGIVALSDGDMAASAFADGKLMKEQGVRDALSVFAFPLKRGMEVGNSLVSNSALSGNKGVVLANDGRTAFVIETRGMTTDSVASVRNPSTDLPAGSAMFIVDLGNPTKPAAKKFSVGKNPMAVDMLQNQLLVTTEEAGKELRLLEIGAGGLPTRNVVVALNLTGGVRATDVTWHPGGEFIALTLEENKEVILYKANRNPQGKIATFLPFGKPLKVGDKPGAGMFTPDGNFYVIADLKDGKANGEVFVVKFTTEGDAATAEHKIVSQATVGAAAEGFAMNPDGTMLVVANKKTTNQPWESTSFAPKSSLSLLSLAKDGKLVNVAETELDGLMPESVCFDKTGDNVAVAVYEYFDFGRRNGGIEFFKVNKTTPALTKQLGKINAPRGCHALRLMN